MKKTFGFLLVAALLVLVIVPTSISAADPEGATSKATVSFTTTDPTNPVDPLDPTDPTKPLDPEGEGTGNVGLLTIDYVPNLTFGVQNITRNHIVAESTNKTPFVQVTDVRATGAGWKLQGNLSMFTLVGGTHQIPNAQINLLNPQVKTNGSSQLNGPVANQPIYLTSNSTLEGVDIMTAQADKGMGTWLTTWLAADGADTNENVILSLDTKDVRVGDYEATLTWTLLQTP